MPGWENGFVRGPRRSVPSSPESGKGKKSDAAKMRRTVKPERKTPETTGTGPGGTPPLLGAPHKGPETHHPRSHLPLRATEAETLLGLRTLWEFELWSSQRAGLPRPVREAATDQNIP